jgi:protein-tyrosine sulfotransferase
LRKPAVPGEANRVLRSLRLGDVYPLARRIAGLPYLAREDFLPEIGPETAGRLRALALRARGDIPDPILIFGVMPRSGTNFVRDVLALHPDVCADPGRLYEFPLLHAARGAAAFMDEFIAFFPRNAEVLGPWDGLALMAGAWLRALQDEAGPRRILLKSPHVQNLSLLTAIFPGARAILCLRDGRDVVDSALRTFGGPALTRKTFSQLALEWRLGAETILAFRDGGPHHHPDVMIVAYEDLVARQDATLARVLAHAGLDASRYDSRALAALPVRGSSRSTRQADARWQPETRGRDFRPVGRWSGWSARRKARFDRIAGDVLERAGYARAAG